VRGPKYSQKKGRTPVLDRDDARALIAAIDAESLTGLRDRALIGIMIYTFGRVGAVLQMKVCDYFSQGRRGWVRLHEKGGKEHEAPCIPKLETYLDEYIAAAGIADDTEGPLFRTTGRSTGTPHRLTQQDAYRLIQRHAKRFFCFIPCGASIAAAVRRSSSRKSHGATAMRMIVSMSLSSTISPANILVAGEWILTRSSNQRRIRQMLSSFRLLLGFDSRLGGICQLWGSAYLTQHPCANSTKLV
jgi:hypothetical protein